MMLTTEDMLTAYDAKIPVNRIVSSGISELDWLTGGMTPGRVWILVGVPGQGRTTLLAQWAAAIAAQSDQAVHFVTPREEPPGIVSRLLALTGKLPLHQITTRTLDASSVQSLSTAREQIAKLSLFLYARGEDDYVPEVHPFRATVKPTSLIIDDADLVSGLTPDLVSSYADSGMFVLLSMPRHVVMTSPAEEADLDPSWARIAHTILEVRHRGLPRGELRPGEADLHVHYNRSGYVRTLSAMHQAHYSRFVELER